MKRTVRILALALVLALAFTAFVACGKRIPGTYTAEAGTYTFKGNDFSFVSGKVELKGTYKIKEESGDLRIYLYLEEELVDGKVTQTYTGDNIKALGDGENGLNFQEGDGFIVIDKNTYYAQ